jgi:DNA-binding HxlR family transcriptional regulator
MQRKSFGRMSCPIARSLERVGEWWSILILRDALHGLTRFDQFQKSLGIAPNMLTRRLSALVDAGLLVRRRYSERPPRDEYVLTARFSSHPGRAAGMGKQALCARRAERASGRYEDRRRRRADSRR